MTETAPLSSDEFNEAHRAEAFRLACELLREQSAPASAPVIAWHEHKAFHAIDEAQSKISLARDALAGISAMLQPESIHYDEQMNMTRRSDASAVFGFFAEAMREPLETLDSAAYMLQSDLRAGHL